MKLRVFLHDELVATLDTGPGQLATQDTVAWTTGIARVSAAWDETPELETLTHWLEACLPENGSRVPFEETRPGPEARPRGASAHHRPDRHSVGQHRCGVSRRRTLRAR